MKKNKGTIIIIVLLSIIILGLIGYICYDKGIILNNKSKEEVMKNHKTTKEETNKSEEWKDIALDDNRFIDLYNILKKYTYENGRGAGADDFNNQELSILAFATADYSNVTFTETSKDQNGNITGTLDFSKSDISLKNIFGQKTEIDFSKTKEYNGWTANAIYNLPRNNSLEKLNITCGFGINSYDKSTNKFEISIINGCGGTSGPGATITERKIISAKTNGDTIEVVEKAIYIHTHSYENNIYYIVYADPSHTKNLDYQNFEVNEVSTKEININAYIDEASTITHTFKLNKETNKYYFEKSIIK